MLETYKTHIVVNHLQNLALKPASESYFLAAIVNWSSVRTTWINIVVAIYDFVHTIHIYYCNSPFYGVDVISVLLSHC